MPDFIPADILTAIFIGLFFVAALVVITAMGRKLRRKRWPEPRYPGNSRAFSSAEKRALQAAMGRASKLAWHRWRERRRASDGDIDSGDQGGMPRATERGG